MEYCKSNCENLKCPKLCGISDVYRNQGKGKPITEDDFKDHSISCVDYMPPKIEIV